jgi:hypothetical protein
MMTREDRQEALSLAYVHAVAAACGMTHSVPSKDYGIDLVLNDIREERHRFTESGWSLAIQLKSTASVVEMRAGISYDLPVRAYDALRATFPVRRILVLSVLPDDERQWVRYTHSRMELRQRAFWISLRGRPAVRNRSSLRLTIPKRQRFTSDGLRAIMASIERGEEL